MRKLLTGLVIVFLALPVFAEGTEQAAEIDSVGVGITTAIPFGDFAQITTFGLGLQGKLPISVAKIPQLIITPAVSLLYYLSPLDSVMGILSFKMDALVGWRFFVTDNISITPSIGYGALFHLTLTDTPQFYVDSGFTLVCEGSYRLSEKLEIYLQPAYQLFLENGALGHQLLISVGVNLMVGGK